MYLCACKAVSDRTIRATIAAGASTPQDIGRLCGAGSRCGGCWPALTELLTQLRAPEGSQDHSAA